MNQRKRITIGKSLVLILSIFLFLFVSFIPAEAQREKFVFGSAIAHTGKFAREGTNLKRAHDFWAGLVNAQGGIEVKGKKYPVEIIYYDDKSDPATATKLIEKLITEDKVDLIFGPFSSDCVGPSSTITEKYKVPMIEAAGNARPLFTRGFKYLFCTLRPADELADPYMRLLSRQSPKPQTVAVIAPKAPFYLSSAAGFKAYGEKYGFQVVHFETYPVEMEDITPILQKVKAKNPDVLCVGSHTVVAMMVMKQSKEIDFNPKAYCFSFGTLTPEFAKELGKDAENTLEYSYISPKAPFSDPLLGTTGQFIDAFKKKYGIYPDGTQACAVAGGISFQTAIQKAGATPPLTEEKRVRVREELAKLKITTGAGPVKFDPTGLNMANPLSIFQIQKGKPVCVDPADWEEAKFIYPAPGWKVR
jgi:branched-chain amino acid transport system substrate-binding protein